MPDLKIQQMRSNPLFKSAGLRRIARLASIVDEVRVPAGTTLDLAPRHNDLLVVDSGQASLKVAGRELRLKPGDVFGELPIEHTHSDRLSQTLVAETDVVLLDVQRPAFRLLTESLPERNAAFEDALKLHAGSSTAGY